MRPAAGPISAAGFRKSVAGALQWGFSCTSCGVAAQGSSRLLEVLRTPCGGGGVTWRQVLHTAVQEELLIKCTRCGTTRQRHVALALQKCPVRACWQEGGELIEGTTVYAAWIAGLNKAMHGLGARGRPQPLADEAAAQAQGAALQAAELQDERSEPAFVPRDVCLRPYRSHVVVRVGEAEVCMQCFSRVPRYRVAAWRDGCCDGPAPLGSCPRHTLAVFATCPMICPPGRPRGVPRS